ncbi:MAG: hypothetical protein HZB16_22120 [Armatimonadetes bacterium]|nr:hypothetical protein [Armatimonadota bacterium]
MSLASIIIDTIAGANEELEPSRPQPELLLLGRLGLYVRVRSPQVQSVGAGTMVVAELRAGTDAQQQNVGVTCVGLGAEPQQAVNEVAAQWSLGVLPVLTQWRDEHTCLASTQPVEFHGPRGSRRFQVILGPVAERGEHTAGEAAMPTVDGYLDMLTQPLCDSALTPALHWLECFAIRSADGSVDATCRLDNRDWRPGRQLLANDALGWPGTTPSFHSRRQFLLLVPEAEQGEEPPARPGLLGRLFGRG